MVSSIDWLVGAAVVGWSGTAAASRNSVGGGDRGSGASMPLTLRWRGRQARRQASRSHYTRYLLHGTEVSCQSDDKDHDRKTSM